MHVNPELIARLFLEAGHQPGTVPSPATIHAVCNALAAQCVQACEEIAGRYPLRPTVASCGPLRYDPEAERNRFARTMALNCANAIRERMQGESELGQETAEAVGMSGSRHEPDRHSKCAN